MRPRQSKVSALPNRFLRAQKRKQPVTQRRQLRRADRKSTRLNSSHSQISYAVFCLKKKNIHAERETTLGQMDKRHDRCSCQETQQETRHTRCPRDSCQPPTSPWDFLGITRWDSSEI